MELSVLSISPCQCRLAAQWRAGVLRHQPEATRPATKKASWGASPHPPMISRSHSRLIRHFSLIVGRVILRNGLFNALRARPSWKHVWLSPDCDVFLDVLRHLRTAGLVGLRRVARVIVVDPHLQCRRRTRIRQEFCFLSAPTAHGFSKRWF